MQLNKQERRKKFTKNEGDERQRKTPRWYMHMKLTVHKNKVMQIINIELCGFLRNHHEKRKRVARHRKVQKKTVDYENVEAKATVEFAVNVQLMLDVGVAKREYGRQGIWHIANGTEMIG